MNDKEIIYNLTKELYRMKGIINSVEMLANEAYKASEGDQNLSTHFVIRSNIIKICNLVDAVSDVEVDNNE